MTQLFDTQPIPITGYAQVALEQGIDTSPNGLTYAIPDAMEDLKIGDRVTVPLGKGNKPVPGYVVGVTHVSKSNDESSSGKIESIPEHIAKIGRIKNILSHDPAGVSLTADLVELAQWISSYYCCPLGMVFATMLPAAVKRGTGRVTRTMVGLAALAAAKPASPLSPLPSPDHEEEDTTPPRPAPKITKLQNAILAQAQQLAQSDQPWMEMKILAELAGARTVTPIKQLIDKGLLATQRQTTVGRGDLVLSKPTRSASDHLKLTDDQQNAIDRLADSRAQWL